MTYLVSYDLTEPGRNYASLREMLSLLGGDTLSHPLESVFVFSSNLPLAKIYEMLLQRMDSTDKLLVTELIGQTRTNAELAQPHFV